MNPTEHTDAKDRRPQIEDPPVPEQYSALRRLAADENHRLVVSLGGGAVPGLCGNIALLQILEELNLRESVSEIWGTSAGAVVGGAWATGTSTQELLIAIRKLQQPGVMDTCWLRVAIAFLLSPLGMHLPDELVKVRRFLDIIRSCLKVSTFEECSIPFRCIACTDDGKAQRKIFHQGPLLSAIHSSMSVPGILEQPRSEGNGECGYYDGALVEKTPLVSPIAEHARSGDPRKLLLLCTHYGSAARQTPAKGFVSRFLHTLYALEDLAWSYQHSEARNRSNVVLVLLDPHIDDPSSFDFSRVDRNYLQAREAFKDSLQNAKLALSFGLS